MSVRVRGSSRLPFHIQTSDIHLKLEIIRGESLLVSHPYMHEDRAKFDVYRIFKCFRAEGQLHLHRLAVLILPLLL